MMLQKLRNPAIAPEPINVPESLSHSKRPKNKKKNKENKESSKPQYHVPRQIPDNLEFPMDQE